MDLNDHAKLRHHRDRYIGFSLGQHLQSPPMLFNRDGVNLWMADTYKGRSAFLILGGPSFGELIKGTTNFNGKNVSNKELLNYPGFVTMCVNNSVKTFRPNLWTIVDNPTSFLKSCWLDPKISKFIPFDHAEKNILDSTNMQEIDTVVGECPSVYFYRRNEHFVPHQFLTEGTFNWGEHSDSMDALGIKGSRSVMLVAIKLLYYLGIRKIFLLGCDFKMDENTKYHFDQDRSKESIKGNMSTYKILAKRFESLLPHFEKAGLKIFNCNENSELKVFPHMAFEHAIEVATNDIPDIETEPTKGLYERDKKKKTEKKLNSKLPITDNKITFDLNKTTYTEEEKNLAKNELDRLRKHLNDMKHLRDTQAIMPDIKQEEIARLESVVQTARQQMRDFEVIKNKVWGIKK